MIEAGIERCTDMDVGKKFVLVCVMTGGAKDEPRTQIKKFGTIVSELDRLAAWLVAEGCGLLQADTCNWTLNLTEINRRSLGDLSMLPLSAIAERYEKIISEELP